VEIQDFAEEYQSKTDDELLRLALDSEQLTPEARAALNDELAGDELIRMNNYRLLLSKKSNAKRSKGEIPEICSFFIPMALVVIGLEKLDASTVQKRARSGLRRLCSLYCCGYR